MIEIDLNKISDILEISDKDVKIIHINIVN